MTIKTVETENQGLKRGFMLTIPAKDIEARVEQEVKRIAPQIRMPGFRPGKVPPNLIRKMHGESLHGDALNNAVQGGVQQLLAEQKIRPAVQPQVELDEQYAPGKDAEVKVTVEALPEIPTPEIDGLKLDRLTVDVNEAQVDAQLEQIAKQSQRWEETEPGHAAQMGELVVMDFDGKVAGKPFEGGKGEDMTVELGSGRLIPGFEDQLVGAKLGDDREVKVTFPKDYPVEALAGKNATFDVTVKGVKRQGTTTIDEEFAQSLGLQSIDQLKGLVRDQLAQELNGLTRTHMKRQLLDQLSERHSFEVPQSMLDAEYENILNQLRHEAGHEEDPQAALAEIEKDADEYRRIAERRVRLGLLLSEIGGANGVEVSEQEMNRLIAQAAAQYQGEDQKRFLQLVQQEPMFAAQLRAPLYEDKVVDFLFGKAEISERSATREEIEADLESEEGHVHGPGCGHDHGAKPATKAKKAAAKGKGKSDEAVKSEAPAKGAVEKSDDKPKPAKPLKDGAGGKPAKAKAEPAKAEAKPAKAQTKPAKAAAAAPAGKAKPKKAPAKKG